MRKRNYTITGGQALRVLGWWTFFSVIFGALILPAFIRAVELNRSIRRMTVSQKILAESVDNLKTEVTAYAVLRAEEGEWSDEVVGDDMWEDYDGTPYSTSTVHADDSGF